MGIFSLKDAEQVRNSIIMREQKRIRKLYGDLYQEVTKRIASVPNSDMQKQNLVLLQRELNTRMHQLSNDIKNGIARSIKTVSSAVVEDTRTFLKSCGFKDSEIHNAFQYVPDQIVRNIYTGNVYGKGWSFSDAIWKMERKNRNLINEIVSRGTAQGKSTLEIAKDIEKFIRPEARKASRVIDFVNPRTGKPDKFYFGNVDYNAQRLARTLINHAYMQSSQATNDKNPFCTGYIWHSAMEHGRTCATCMDRDGQLFEKGEVPEDHPNGLCTIEPYIENDMSEIAKMIGDWYNSPDGTFPEIDEYAMTF